MRSAENRKALKAANETLESSLHTRFLLTQPSGPGADTRRILEVNSDVELPPRRKKIGRRVPARGGIALRVRACFQREESGASRGGWPVTE